MKLEIGKTYINTDPVAWPEFMKCATITITDIDQKASENQLAVAYSFIDTSGKTGEGTMLLSHAQEHLRPAFPEGVE